VFHRWRESREDSLRICGSRDGIEPLRAVRVNIEIMRAFVQLHRMLGANEELARRLDTLEQKYDGQFREVFRAIRELMTPPRRAQRTIGFHGARR
jgi:hypothetical protein